MDTLLHIEEPPPRPASASALFALGFRPFYLLASGFAALSVPLWALQFSGVLTHPYLQGPLWHAHEMLFGFALAVIVGFLFTAGRNWTQQPTPTGAELALIAGLWLAARVLVLTPWSLAAALANVAFVAAAALGLARPLVRSGNRRNYFFVGLLGLMTGASALVHLGALGLVPISPWTGIRVGLDVVLFIMVVMAGRVVPMFTNNALPGANAGRHPRVEQAALGSVLAVLAADALGLGGPVAAALAALAAAAHVARWLLWRPWKTRGTPLLWILHAAYAWIPLHLLLRATAEAGWTAPSLATHALTVGAIGGLVIGMMTRTARGHTGRLLRSDGYEVAAYGLVMLAATVRVFVPLVAPTLLLPAVLGSAMLWSTGFGIYALRYGPILSRPRLDGRPG